MHGLAPGVHVGGRRGGGAGEAGDLPAELADPAEPQQVHGSQFPLVRHAGQAVGTLGDDLAQRRGLVVVGHGVGAVGDVCVGGHGCQLVVPGEGAKALLRSPFVGYVNDVLATDCCSGST